MNKPTLIPVYPAHQGSLKPQEGQALLQPGFCQALLAIIMRRNNVAEMTFTQADFDDVAGLVVLEGRGPANEFLLGLGYKSGVLTS